MRWKTEIPGPNSYQADMINMQSIVGGKMSQAGAS